MLNHLDGTVCDLAPDSVVIDCGGIGFEVAITPNTASMLTNGEKGKLYITEAIGEDHFDLFGFNSKHEKYYFRLLTGVSGIGPKAAMAILSYNTPEMITSAIINGNESAFTACPGIGKKTAQRVILELKDKIAKEVSRSGGMPESTGGQSFVAPNRSSSYDEALTALSVLGYSSQDVVPVLKQINTESMTTEQIIRAVLKYMV